MGITRVEWPISGCDRKVVDGKGRYCTRHAVVANRDVDQPGWSRLEKENFEGAFLSTPRLTSRGQMIYKV